MSPLKDQTVLEEETVTLTCKLSKPDQEVKWYRKDNVMAIQPSAKYDITSEGTEYSLTIKNATAKDTIEYTMKCGLFISTKAKVAVKGEPLGMNVWFFNIHSLHFTLFNCNGHNDWTLRSVPNAQLLLLH